MTIAAFFDMDGTILAVNSGTEYLRLMWRLGKMPLPKLVRGGYWLAQYKLGLLDGARISEISLRDVVGDPEAEMRERCESWYARDLAPHIYDEARAAIQKHREAGHPVALLTSATQFAAEPLARELGIEHVLCTRLEVVEGKFTGKLSAPLCFGDGKVTQAEDFASQHGVDLDRSYFYTDSVTDRAMLLRVGHPRVVNPDPRLRRLAAQLRWPVERWSRAKGRPRA